MSLYTPTSVKLTPYVIPADGEDVDASSVNVAFEALGDGVQYLTEREGLVRVLCPANVGQVWETTSAQVTGVGVGSFWPLLAGATTAWQIVSGSGAGRIVYNRSNAGSTNAWGYKFGIDQYLVDGATLNTCVMRHQASAMYGGSLPAVMPKFGIARYDADDVVVGLLAAGLVADPSVDTTAFKLLHSVTFTADQNNVIDKSLYSYALIFWTEASTNAIGGSAIHSFKVTMT